MDKTEIVTLAVTTVMIVTDYLTGVIKAAMQHDISSSKMREGLYHKGAYVIVILLAEIIDHASTIIDLGIGIPLVAPACVYIILTELASIIENLGEINPELKDSRVLQLFRTTKAE